MLIFKIAKAEFRTIFCSPVAWFVSIAFLFLWGVAYTGSMTGMALMQEMALKYSPGFKSFGDLNMGWSLTFLLLGSPDGIGMGMLGVVVKYLFLFIPLLTMGIISREVQAGTDKLLYSSPVRLRQIVLGKFLGMIFFSLILVAAISIILVSILLSVKSPDIGLLFSVLLGFFLLIATYSAIGMFVSSLSSYQVVSALAAFLVLGLLNNIGNLWQQIDFVRDITYFLSLSGRGEKMLTGLITSKDLIYFLLVISMFICFTIIRLKGKRESKAWYITPGRYSIVFVLVLVIGFASSRPALTLYWDATATNRNTLPENIQQIIKKMDKGPLEVTLYTNLVGQMAFYGFPVNRNKFLTKVWEPYLRFKPDIKFKYVYYYDYMDSGGPAKEPENEELNRTANAVIKFAKLDRTLIKKPTEIRKMIDLKYEAEQPVMQLKYNGNTGFMRAVSSAVNENMKELIEAAALKRMIQPAPKIYFLTGHYERNVWKSGEREYWAHTIQISEAKSMSNHGFEIDTLAVDEHDIPADASVLVLADPKSELSQAATFKLRQYIEKGGNMLILGEPRKQEILSPLLDQLGIKLMAGQLVQPSNDETPDKVLPHTLDAAIATSPELADLHQSLRSKNATLNVLMPGVTAVAAVSSGLFEAKPLLASSQKNAWLKAGKLVSDSAAVLFAPNEGDSAASFPVVMALTRNLNGREQRIVVAGDADFMNNQRFKLPNNIVLINALYSWMNYNEFPIYAPRPAPVDTLVKMSAKAANVQRKIYTWVLPGLLIILAAIFLIRRKRK